MRASEQIAEAIVRVRRAHVRPVIVALDGGSGAGKSTLASLVQPLTDAVLIRLDDFYTTVVPEQDWPARSVQERLQLVFDWERLSREALLPLRAGRPGRWHAFDFLNGPTVRGTYGLHSEPTVVAPPPVILLEGSYSASPPLADLIDLAVLVQVEADERRRRTERRDGTDFQERWRAVWSEVEEHYYSQVRPPDRFDLVVANKSEG